MTPADGGPFSVLVVCTGNICRSPQAAQLLQAKVDEAGETWRTALSITSAGTRALEDFPMDEQAAELAAAHGASPAEHRARQLTAQMVEATDLVLCAAREHRRDVVRTVPRASRNAFMLTEFADLLEGVVQTSTGQQRSQPQPGSAAGSPGSVTLQDQLRHWVNRAASHRGLIPPRDPETVDVLDPYRQAPEIYRRSAEQVSQVVERIHQSALKLAEGTSS